MSSIEIQRDIGRGVRIIFNGVATLGILVGGAIAWLGYRLYVAGVAADSAAEVAAKSKFLGLTISGTGPGLFFVGLGAIIVIASVIAVAVTAASGRAAAAKKPSARRTRKPNDDKSRLTNR